jgi:pimeloyl-ACP methyl ester carboxylesterase
LTKTVFLPGAGGRRSFWQPVAERLSLGPNAVLLGWPGFGDEPPDPRIRSLAGLTGFVLDRVEGDFNLVAQSMGGVVALQIALHAPARLKRLVLCATSGGVDFGAIEREDWRLNYRQDPRESAPGWFADDRTDLSSRLREIQVPVLLVWGKGDKIVPPAAGRLLESLLPHARLVVIPGASHDVAQTNAERVADAIAGFLAPDASREA